MRCLQPIRNLHGDIEHLVDGQERCLRRSGRGNPRPCPNPLAQRLTFQQLHGEEGLALMLAEFVNRADVGMIQRRGSARFALKPLQSARIVA